MKTRWYRKSGVKGLLVLLTIVFVTVACAGAGASVLIMSKGVQPLDSKNYVDSQSFQDNMYSLSHTIINAINEREILDQADDGELVDLAELNKAKTHPDLPTRQGICMTGRRNHPGIKVQMF